MYDYCIYIYICMYVWFGYGHANLRYFCTALDVDGDTVELIRCHAEDFPVKLEDVIESPQFVNEVQCAEQCAELEQTWLEMDDEGMRESEDENAMDIGGPDQHGQSERNLEADELQIDA